MQLNEEKEKLQKEVEELEKQAEHFIERKKLEHLLKSKKELKKEYSTAKKEYQRKIKNIYRQKEVLKHFKIKNLIFSTLCLSIIFTSGITLAQYDINNDKEYRIYDYTSYYNDGIKETIDDKETTHYNDFKSQIDLSTEEARYDQAIITLKSPFEKKERNYERVVSTYKLDCSENNITEETLKEYINNGFFYTKDKLSSTSDIITYEYRNNIDATTNKGEVICEANILNNVTNKNEANETKETKIKHPIITSILTGGGISLLGYSIFLTTKRKTIHNQIEKTSKNRYGFDRNLEKEKIKKLKMQYKKKK